jgi:hypothetical protein
MDLSVADEVSSWASEPIPDENYLWMRVHKSQLPDGDIAPGAFKNRPTTKDGMSTDWEKYATPQDTCNRGRVPTDNAVIRLLVGDVRKIPDQTVVHTPDLKTENRAHTDVYGDKNPEVRVKLIRISKIEISL